MDHWQRIFNYLSLPTTTTLYIGVGTSMSHYAEVTEQNNQQYPCFLNNFSYKDGQGLYITSSYAQKGRQRHVRSVRGEGCVVRYAC